MERLNLTALFAALLAFLVMAQGGASATKAGTNPPYVQIVDISVGENCVSGGSDSAKAILNGLYLWSNGHGGGLRFHVNPQIATVCLENFPYWETTGGLIVQFEQEMVARGLSTQNTYVAVTDIDSLDGLCAPILPPPRPVKATYVPTIDTDSSCWQTPLTANSPLLAMVVHDLLRTNFAPTTESNSILCEGSGCTLITSQIGFTPTDVARFATNPLFDESVGVAIKGAGSVSSQPASETCPNGCGGVLYFQAGTSATLTATPAAGNHFVGWKDACSGTSPTCSLVMNTPARLATAVFEPNAPKMVRLSGLVLPPAAGKLSYLGKPLPRAVTVGQSVSVKVQLRPGWIVKRWSVPGCGHRLSCRVVPKADLVIRAYAAKL